MRATQEWLAETVGLSRQSAISNIENDTSGVSIELLARLADALQVEMRWLATGESSDGLVFLGASEPDELEMTDDARKVCELYMALPAAQRAAILQILKGLSDKPKS